MIDLPAAGKTTRDLCGKIRHPWYRKCLRLRLGNGFSYTTRYTDKASNKMDPGQDPQPKAKKLVKSLLISPLAMSGSVASTYGGVAERP